VARQQKALLLSFAEQGASALDLIRDAFWDWQKKCVIKVYQSLL
jgi:hypothetical protein